MRRLKRRWLVKSSLIVLTTSFALCAVANDTPPVAQCNTYLTMSAASFSNAIANKENAGSISATLSSCEKYNVCSQLNGITNCAALLFNRGFASTLAFNSADVSASTNNSISSDFQNTNTDADTNNSSNTATTNITAPTPAYVGSGNTNTTNKNKKAINWF